MSFSNDLLKWYDQHHRRLPWRANPGQRPNPYHVWVSEIMLQQTTVPTVIDYFNRFTQKWPTIQDLAKSSLDEVLHMWQGLGYYSRARNLHKCAQKIMIEYEGYLPKDEKALLGLPGIGPYTAAAILSIAFDMPAAVVDGNIERILSRLFIISTPVSQSKKIFKEKINTLITSNRPGDFAQALMDLGSSICTPKKPDCTNCPIQYYCKAFNQKNPENFPVKLDKRSNPKKYGYVYLILNKDKEILLEKRPNKGLLAGLHGFPTSEWLTTPPSEEMLKNNKWENLRVTEKTIQHTFTHFHLELTIVIGSGHSQNDTWVTAKTIGNYALPTLMKKVWHKYENVG